jgi:hypothetical protein
MSQNIVKDAIEEKRQKRDKLLAQLNILDAEIKTLEEVYKKMSGNVTEVKATRNRPLSDEWQDILFFIMISGNTSLDKIEEYSNSKGYGFKRNVIRSQAKIYVDKGYIDRISDGIFSITQLGAGKCKDALKLHSAQKNEAPKGASVVEDGQTSSNINNDDWDTIPF